MNIKPLSDRVVLKWVEKESITKSGIYLPESANAERPHMYEVIAIGPGKKDIDMWTIAIWDKVLCGQYAWDEIKVEDESYKVVAIDYILAIVK